MYTRGYLLQFGVLVSLFGIHIHYFRTFLRGFVRQVLNIIYFSDTFKPESRFFGVLIRKLFVGFIWHF